MITQSAHRVARTVLPANSKAWFRWLEARQRREDSRLKRKKSKSQFEQLRSYDSVVYPPATPVPPRPRHKKPCKSCEKIIPLSSMHGTRVSG